MKNGNKYFYCYSPKLRRFITEQGINWTDRGINENSGHRYWVFANNEKLSEVIKKYKNK